MKKAFRDLFYYKNGEKKQITKKILLKNLIMICVLLIVSLYFSMLFQSFCGIKLNSVFIPILAIFLGIFYKKFYLFAAGFILSFAAVVYVFIRHGAYYFD